MKTLLIGYGEVGRAHFEVLKDVHDIYYKDKGPEIFNAHGGEVDIEGVDLFLVATQCDPMDMGAFHRMVRDYAGQYSPLRIDVLSTVPPMTCEKIKEILPHVQITRSTIRGMHPNLAKFLIDIPKHVGGDDADVMGRYYEAAGITCVVHAKARAVELFHPLNNFIYGVNVMAADECARYCREYGIDYIEFLEYRKTNNEGFLKAGYPSKVSPILYPSGGKIGGHCVCYAPTTIPEDKRGPLAEILADYNKNA